MRYPSLTYLVVILASVAMASCAPPPAKLILPSTPLPDEGQREVRVHAANEWQDTGIDVQRGESYAVTATGRWSVGGLCGQTDADGQGLNLLCWIDPWGLNIKPSTLIGRIGEQGQPFRIGSSFDFIAPQDGRLFLRIYDITLGDNSGHQDVRIVRGVSASAIAGGSVPDGALPELTSIEVKVSADLKSVTWYADWYLGDTPQSGHRWLDKVGFLRGMLERASLFRQGGEPRMTLHADLASFEDIVGTSFNAGYRVVVDYRLNDSQGHTVFKERIATEGRANFGEAFAAGTLVQMASDRALLANAERLIESLRRQLPEALVAYRGGVASGTRAVATHDSGSGSGYFALEDEIAFNVLERIAFDPATRQVTLIGRADPRYVGPRIPYLQHLATLLENPAPEFTLEWTPQTERAVSDFFRRMDDPHEMAAFAGTAGAIFTPDGMPTASGRRVLARAGIHPVAGNRRPGFLGLRVRSTTEGDQTFGVVVQEVVPGSPAARAGLRPNDRLMSVHGSQALHPHEFVAIVRRAGAGTTIDIMGLRESRLFREQVALGEGQGDPWDGYTRADIVALLLRHTGNGEGAKVIEAYQTVQRLTDNPYLLLPAINQLYLAANTPLRGFETAMANYNAVFDDVRGGRLTERQAIRRIFFDLLEGMEYTLRLPAASLTGPYQRAVRSGVDPESAFDAVVVSDLHRQVTEVALAEALRTVLRRQEEMVITARDIGQKTGVVPVVRPQYIGLPPDSQTARVMFQADYLGKTLFFAPSLARRVPGYRTEYAHDIERKLPVQRDALTTRAWLSVGALDLAQGGDGNILEIRELKMRFNMRDRRAGGKEVFTSGGYPELLTGLYDDMARVLPPLHELREVAKMRVAALWILSKAPDFRLPKEGRTAWRGPDSAPMPVHLIWSPHHDPVRAVAAGGVSLAFPDVPPVPRGVPLVPVLDYPVPVDPQLGDLRDLRDVGMTALPDTRLPDDAAIVDLRGLGATPIDLKAFDARPRIRVAREVPLPPPPYGGTRLAQKGDALLKSLNLRVPAAGPRCDPEQLAALGEEVAEVRRLIGELQMTEAAMNLVSQANPRRQELQAQLVAGLRTARADIETAAIDLATRGMLDSYDILRIRAEFHGLGEVTQGVDLLIAANERLEAETKTWEQRIDRLKLAYRAATADDLESLQRAMSDVTDVMGDTLAALDSVSGDDRASKLFRAAGKVVKKAKKAKQLMDAANGVRDLAGTIRQRIALDRMDDVTARRLHEQYRKRFDAVTEALRSPSFQALQEGRIPAECG